MGGMLPGVPLDQVICGHALDVLRQLPSSSVNTCVTSPPYWGLRSYNTEPQIWGGRAGCMHEWISQLRIVETTHKGGNWQQANNGQGMVAGKLWTRFRGDTTAATANRTFEPAAFGKCKRCGAWRGELGLEPTPALYVEHLVAILGEVRRVLRPDGTLWLNLGDCYAGNGGFGGATLARGARPDGTGDAPVGKWQLQYGPLKVKDLVMMPARVALALQAAGWWLRCDIIWSKPNPLPESVRDRPTRAHEYVFLFSKNRRYYYDAAAIAEPLSSGPSDLRKMAEGLDRIGGKHRVTNDPFVAANARTNIGRKRAVGPRFRSGNLKRDIPNASDGRGIPNDHRGRGIPWENTSGRRNARSVWTVATQPFTGAHFATFPLELAKRCILAGCRAGGIVLDPFIGSGTTAEAALRLRRHFLGIELNPRYVDLSTDRMTSIVEKQAETDLAA